jgi:hypothetical protein
MELVDIVSAVVVGALLGIGIVGIYVWVLYHRLKSRIDQMIKEVVAEAEADLVGLEIEVDNGVYFCYNHDDKQFVCQGTTVAEIKQAFGERFPTKTAYLAGGDPAVIAEFKTELLKLGINENIQGQ